MAFLDTQPALGYPLAAALGLAVGSFLNVVILRLPRRLEWEWKRDAREILELPELYDPPPPGVVVEPSHDPVTGDRLKWWENIPVFSWLALRGRSRYSGQKISIQYPLVELLVGLLTVLCAWRFGFGWQGFGAMVFTWFLVALSGIDLRTRLLPDQLTLSLKWALWDGGYRNGRIEEAESQIRSLEASGEDLRNQVRLQVERAWLDFQLATVTVGTATKRVEAAEVYYDMARQRFLNGLGTSLEVQDSLRNLNDARQNLVVATYDRELAFAALENSVGVDFPLRRLAVSPEMLQTPGR